MLAWLSISCDRRKWPSKAASVLRKEKRVIPNELDLHWCKQILKPVCRLSLKLQQPCVHAYVPGKSLNLFFKGNLTPKLTATTPPHSHVIRNINFHKNRANVPGVPCTQARNNGLRVLGGRQHDDLTIRKEAEVPVITKSAVRAKLTVEPRSVKHPPVVLNVVPSSVEAIQRFLSLTDVWRLADIDTWKTFYY